MSLVGFKAKNHGQPVFQSRIIVECGPNGAHHSGAGGAAAVAGFDPQALRVSESVVTAAAYRIQESNMSLRLSAGWGTTQGIPGHLLDLVGWNEYVASASRPYPVTVLDNPANMEANKRYDQTKGTKSVLASKETLDGR